MNYDNAEFPVVSATSGGSTSTFMIFAAGALVGAAVALVMAPANGRETRVYLNQRGRKLADDVATRGKEIWNEHGAQVSAAVEQGYKRATDAIKSRVSDAVEEGKTTYREAKDHAQKPTDGSFGRQPS